MFVKSQAIVKFGLKPFMFCSGPLAKVNLGNETLEKVLHLPKQSRLLSFLEGVIS